MQQIQLAKESESEANKMKIRVSFFMPILLLQYKFEMYQYIETFLTTIFSNSHRFGFIAS